jgi:hypothetical protein
MAVVDKTRTTRAIKFVPRAGERIFSVNLVMVDFSHLAHIVEELGLQPEFVQMTYRNGMAEFHALLWQGRLDDEPPDLEAKYDLLSERIDPDAIHFAAGRSRHAVV